MRIADESTHRALAYVAAATRSGGSLTVDQLDAYVMAPDRAGPKYSSTDFVSSMAVLASMADVFGRGRQVAPAELPSQHLARLEWAKVEDSQIRLTDLGQTILRGLDRPVVDLDTDAPVAVIINPEDPFAHIRVFDLIASREGGLLVDPYIGAKELLDVFAIPTVRRVLTGSRKNAEHALMQRALSIATDPPEVRWISQEHLHDRFFIPDSGDVIFFGSSLNTLARRPGVVAPLPDPAASAAVKSAYTALWNEATKLPPAKRDGRRNSDMRTRSSGSARGCRGGRRSPRADGARCAD